MSNELNKMEQQAADMREEKKEEIMDNFNRFASYLGSTVVKAEKAGMSEETIAKSAEKVADYLAKHEEPKNREEYLLQELWKHGEKDERHMFSHMLVRMVKEYS